MKPRNWVTIMIVPGTISPIATAVLHLVVGNPMIGVDGLLRGIGHNRIIAADRHHGDFPEQQRNLRIDVVDAENCE